MQPHTINSYCIKTISQNYDVMVCCSIILILTSLKLVNYSGMRFSLFKENVLHFRVRQTDSSEG